LLLSDLAGPGVEDTERAHDHAVMGLEGGTGVEADTTFTKEGFAGIEGVFGCIGDNENTFGGHYAGEEIRVLSLVHEGEGIV